LHLWPHARPWHLGDPKPTLRCIPDAAATGERLLAAWQAQMQAQEASPVALRSVSTTPTPSRASGQPLAA